MKKTASALACGAIAALTALTACVGGARNDENLEIREVQLESYTYDLVGRDDSDSTRADSLRLTRFTSDIVLPLKIGRNDISQLRDSLMALAQVQFPSKGRPAPVLPDGFSITDVNPKTAHTPGILVNSLSVDLLTSTLVVWENYCYEYEVFMAHGIRTTSYLNYSIADNRILCLADLMKRGYERPLLAILREAVKDTLGDNLLVDISEVEIPSNFRIKANGIEFIYGPTEIAPASEGEVNIKLSLMDLEGLLSTRGIRLILGPQSE